MSFTSRIKYIFLSFFKKIEIGLGKIIGNDRHLIAGAQLQEITFSFVNLILFAILNFSYFCEKNCYYAIILTVK